MASGGAFAKSLWESRSSAESFEQDILHTQCTLHAPAEALDAGWPHDSCKGTVEANVKCAMVPIYPDSRSTTAAPDASEMSRSKKRAHLMDGDSRRGASCAKRRAFSSEPDEGVACGDDKFGKDRSASVGGGAGSKSVMTVQEAQRAYREAIVERGALIELSAPELSELHSAHLEMLEVIQDAQWRLMEGDPG